MHAWLKTSKTVTVGTRIILAILISQAQLRGQTGQVKQSARDTTKSSVSKPGNKTPQTGSDIPCVKNGPNSSGVKLQTTPANPGQHQVDLTWKASSSPGSLNYNVHRCTPGGPCSMIKTVTSTSYADTQVQPQQTYCYFVTAAVGAGGRDSDPSNVLQVTIPSP
jgi:hypothetical protein